MKHSLFLICIVIAVGFGATSLAGQEIDTTSSLLHLCGASQSCDCPEGYFRSDEPYYLPDKSRDQVYRCLSLKSLQIPLGNTQAFLTLIGLDPSCESIKTRTSSKDEMKAKIPLVGQLSAEPLSALVPSIFPSGCTYREKGFSAKAYQETIDHFLVTHEVLCDSKHYSMCTSSTFLVFLEDLRELVAEGRVSPNVLVAAKDIKSDAWKLLNIQGRPDLLVDQFKDVSGKPLGESKVLRAKDLPSPGWPAPGDIVQIWRKNLSGHSVIFQSYLKDQNGKTVGLCYWSSNEVTNGYGYRCEPLDIVKTMIVGRLHTEK